MSLSKRLRFRVLARDQFTCQYCGRTSQQIELHVDHVIPRSKGGLDVIENLKTACRDCNLGKGAQVMDFIFTLVPGPNGAGPMDGETVTVPRKGPITVLWVYRFTNGERGVIRATQDLTAVMEWPYCVYLPQGTASQTDPATWHGWYTERGEYPRLEGMYLAPDENHATRGMLAWIPAADLIDNIAGIGSAVRPDTTPPSDDEWQEGVS